MDPIEGRFFKATYSEVKQERISSELAERRLSAATLAAIKQPVVFSTIRTKRVAGKLPTIKPMLLTDLTKEELVDLLGKAREHLSIKEQEEKILKEMLSRFW